MAKDSIWGVFKKLVGVPSSHVEQKKDVASTEKPAIEPKQKVQPEEIIKTPKPKPIVKSAEPIAVVPAQPSIEREPLVQTKAEKQFFQILERAGTGAPIFQEDLQAFAELLKSGIRFDQSGGAKNVLAIEYLCDTYFPNPGLLKLLLENNLDPKTKWGNNAPILVLINRGFEAYSKGHIDDNDEDFAQCAVLLSSFGAIREKEDWEDVRSLLPKPSDNGLAKPEDAYIRKMRDAIRKGAEMYQDLKKREAAAKELGEAKPDEKGKKKRSASE